MNLNASDVKENVFEYLDDSNMATITAGSKGLQAVLKKLAKKYPNECQIVTEAKNNSGYLVAHINVLCIEPRHRVEIEK